MRRLLSILLVTFALSGCELIHGWPGEDSVDPSLIMTELKIDIQMDMEVSEVITRSILSATDTSAYDRRFIVEISRDESYDQSLVERDTITVPSQDFGTVSLRTELHALKYKVAVWSDYVEKGSRDDLFYLTEDLEHVRILGKDLYTGSNMFKDCQRGCEGLDLTGYAVERSPEVELRMQLERPVARIVFRTMDFDRFVTESGLENTRQEIADRLIVRFTYPTYVPSSINALTGKLNDSYTDYGFESGALYDPQSDDLKMGYDYVFVNGEKSSVTVSLQIYDKVTGKQVNDTGHITVPTERGKETVVKDRFLTRDGTPGIGIDPGFDGEYNIYY